MNLVRILLVLVVCSLVMSCALFRGSAPGPLDRGKSTAAAAIDSLKDQVELDKLKTEAQLGRDAGKRMLARAAQAVGWFSAFLAVISVASLILGSYFGGFGRKSALMGLAIAAAGIPLAYFITVYGYVVSEAICWVALIGIFAVALPLGCWMGYTQFRAWNARQLSSKRADEGGPAKDVFYALPVSKAKKSELDDHWDTARDPSASVSDRLVSIAALAKYKLSIPQLKPDPGVPAGTGSQS